MQAGLKFEYGVVTPWFGKQGLAINLSRPCYLKKLRIIWKSLIQIHI
jgi:hypothetical protein